MSKIICPQCGKSARTQETYERWHTPVCLIQLRRDKSKHGRPAKYNAKSRYEKNELLFRRPVPYPIDNSYPYELWTIIKVPLISYYTDKVYESSVLKVLQMQQAYNKKGVERKNSISIIDRTDTHIFIEIHLYFADWVKKMYVAHLFDTTFGQNGQCLIGKSGTTPMTIPDITPILSIHK